MEKLLISLGIGILAGIADILPMIARKLDKDEIISAFAQWVVASFVIFHIDIGLPGWLTGMVVAVVMGVPIILLVMKTEKKAIGTIAVMCAVLGSLVGFVRGLYGG